MLKPRKVNKVETITMMLITKYIIRHIIPINHVKKKKKKRNPCIIKFLLYYSLIRRLYLYVVVCCMVNHYGGQVLRDLKTMYLLDT